MLSPRRRGQKRYPMKRNIHPPKTGPSAATTAILVLLSAMIFCYALFQVVSRSHSDYELASAYTYTADDETTVSGFVVRTEQLLDNQSGGTLDITRAEGERVAVGQSVATVYSDSSAMETQTQLETLQAQRAQLAFALDASTGTGSATAANKRSSSIQSSIIALQQSLRDRQYTAREQNSSTLKSLIIQQSYSADELSRDELTARLQETDTQIKTLTAQLQRSAKNVTVSTAALFSAVVDGYETTLTPAMLDTMTPSQLSAVTADSSKTSNVGKLILGDTWYYAASMDEQAAASYKVGHSVTLRFVKELNRDLTMKIARISDSENGKKLVVFSCDEYLPEVTLLRRQSANIIHESYTGIRVPSEALRVEEGVSGVFCLVGMQAVFKPVDIIYQGSGYYLVEPSKNADDTENTTSSRLRVGDSVIITAKELYNGKVVE